MAASKIVSHNLKRLREERGLQQKFVADYIGISANYYCQIENGHRGLATKYLPKIKELFKVTLDEIFFDKEIANCDSDKTA